MSTFDDLLAAFLELSRAAEFDPSQKRDDTGKWSDGGGSGGKKANPPKKTAKPVDWFDSSPDVVKRAATQGIVAVGQLSKDETKQLEKAVKAGQLMKVDDYTFPVTKKRYVLHPDYWSAE